MVAVLSFLLQRQYQTQLTPRNVQKESPSLAQLPQLICTGFVTQLTGFMREERFFFFLIFEEQRGEESLPCLNKALPT